MNPLSEDELKQLADTLAWLNSRHHDITIGFSCSVTNVSGELVGKIDVDSDFYVFYPDAD